MTALLNHGVGGGLTTGCPAAAAGESGSLATQAGRKIVTAASTDADHSKGESQVVYMLCDHSGLVMDEVPFQGLPLGPVQNPDWNLKSMLLFMVAVWVALFCIRAGYASRRPSFGVTSPSHARRRHCRTGMARLSNDLSSVTQIFHDRHLLLPHLALHSRTQADGAVRMLRPYLYALLRV